VGKITDQIYNEIQKFIVHEAKLNDRRQFRDWLNLMAEDLEYRVPVRVTRYKDSGSEFSETMTFVDDDFYTLEKRISRLETEYAWAEDPPSRTRHMVCNIEVLEGEKEDEYQVNSDFLLLRYRGSTCETLSGERRDILRRTNGSLKLAKRIVLLDQTILPVNNLSIFL
jgi:3-phenylpropionate/cinnamic acid dioxygenase small subunit